MGSWGEPCLSRGGFLLREQWPCFGWAVEGRRRDWLCFPHPGDKGRTPLGLRLAELLAEQVTLVSPQRGRSECSPLPWAEVYLAFKQIQK